jgi:anti-sigma B factor antagonist
MDFTELFTVDIAPDGGALVASLQGELDMAAAPSLRDALDTALKQDPESLVVDLSELKFLDSCGLGELVRARNRLPATKDMVVRRARPNVRKVFMISGLTRGFTFED